MLSSHPLPYPNLYPLLPYPPHDLLPPSPPLTIVFQDTVIRWCCPRQSSPALPCPTLLYPPHDLLLPSPLHYCYTGHSHSLVLSSSGNVFTFGRNDTGALGHADSCKYRHLHRHTLRHRHRHRQLVPLIVWRFSCLDHNLSIYPLDLSISHPLVVPLFLPLNNTTHILSIYLYHALLIYLCHSPLSHLYHTHTVHRP